MKYYYSAKEFEIDRRKKLTWSIMYVIIPLLGSFSLIHFMQEEYRVAIFNAVLCLVQIINMILISRTYSYNIGFRINALLLSVHFINNILLGGNGNSYILWIIVFPCVVFIFFSVKEALAWSGFLFAGVILTIYPGSSFLKLPDYHPAVVQRVLIVYLLVTFIMITMERFRQKLYNGFSHHENILNEEIKKSIEAKKDAEHAAEFKSRFLATMSHEIRNPLSVIIGMTDLIFLEKSDKKKDEYLRIIRDSSSHLYSLINDVLDYSRIQDGRIELQQNNFDIHELLDNIYNSFHDIFRNKNLEWNTETRGFIPDRLIGDSVRLRQVLINIINNAHKFTDSGGVKLCMESADNSEVSDNASTIIVRFTISDTGHGIPENRIEEIFNSYSQVRITQDADSGVGLGLAISKNIIKAMGGSISVKSSVNTGSTFTIDIPFKKETGALLKTEQASIEDNNQGRSGNILIAEDNVMIQLFLKKAVNKFGYQSTTVHDGASALSMLKDHKFDLVIMDIEMPVMNGNEAAERIRSGESGEDNRHIPIMALTGNLRDSETEYPAKELFNRHLTKPVSIDTLKTVLYELIKK